MATNNSIQIISMTLGPAMTNAYLIGDEESKTAVVIDPAWDGHLILGAAEQRGWRITKHLADSRPLRPPRRGRSGSGWLQPAPPSSAPSR